MKPIEEIEEDIGYVTVQQAAKMIGVHRDAVYQAIDTGKLRRSDVEAYRPRTYRGRHKSEPAASSVGTDASVVAARYELPTDLLRRYHALLDEKFTSDLTADLATPLAQEASAQERKAHQERMAVLDNLIAQLKSLVE